MIQLGKRYKSILFKSLLFLSITLFYACPSDLSYFPTILEELASAYIQLPEEQISMSSDGSVFAQYADPTEKYTHGILGDQIEAEKLVVVADSTFYELDLEENFVFEDIRPRLYDVDSDGSLEIITIRTNIERGAGIAIYKIIDNQLEEYAFVPEIGSSNRWLNIVAIDDIDQDGVVEILWIETPHIGGILKIAKIQAGELQVLSEQNGYSNHAIGEKNLCLSVLGLVEDQRIAYVPNQERNKVVGFSFQNSDLEIHSEIDQAVDFSTPLQSQLVLNELIQGREDNCIFVQ